MLPYKYMHQKGHEKGVVSETWMMKYSEKKKKQELKIKEEGTIS